MSNIIGSSNAWLARQGSQCRCLLRYQQRPLFIKISSRDRREAGKMGRQRASSGRSHRLSSTVNKAWRRFSLGRHERTTTTAAIPLLPSQRAVLCRWRTTRVLAFRRPLQWMGTVVHIHRSLRWCRALYKRCAGARVICSLSVRRPRDSSAIAYRANKRVSCRGGQKAVELVQISLSTGVPN